MHNNEIVWLNDISRQFLERDYLLPGQSVEERIDTICNTAEQILNKPGFAQAFKENLSKGWYSLSTPIWNNFGCERGLPISCFSTFIEDTMPSILEAHAEVGMQTKMGGGTSAYFGKLRPRGAVIKNNGKSSGPVHFMQLFDTLINVCSQGSARRGNFAAYLDIDHPDIMEFLSIRDEGNPIQDISFGVCVPDYWMQEMIDGDNAKRTVWARLIQARANKGYPYIFFTDTVNRNTVDVYKDKKMKIHSSQLCVVGNQRVVSDRGLKTVKELYEEGGNLRLFDNTKIVQASPMRLIERNAKVYKITLSNGMTHTVTDYHKIQIRPGQRSDQTEMRACKNLQIGDFVGVQTNKGLFGQIHMPEEAFLLGHYHGDGTQTDKQVMIDLWENDFDLIEPIEKMVENVCARHNLQFCEANNRTYDTPAFTNCTVVQSTVAKKRLGSVGLKKLGFEKHVIPHWIWEGDEETQWAFIKGLYITDGTVNTTSSNGNPMYLSVVSINKEYLESIQLILANLGIKSSLGLMRSSGFRSLPDGKGGYKDYPTQDIYRLVTGNKPDAITFNKHTQFLDRKNVFIEDRVYRDNTKKFFQIVSIEYVGEEDVYCTTVDSDEHTWICNGFITSNCAEITLPTTEQESFVCDLSSMNIVYFDQWKDTNAVELLVYFLDAVMSEFIAKSKNIPFMKRAWKFASQHRALGIGWLGWHDYLQSKMIAWESMEAKLLNTVVAKTIHNQAYAASAKLAQEYGEPELLKGYGRRNTTLLAIAPTKSSSFIIGQTSEGIQPFTTNYEIKDLQKGKYTIKNRHLERLLEQKGCNTPEIWASILKRGGSVQHLECLSPEEKAVFKTFAEISQKEIIIQAAGRQKYIDQSQSLNLMIHPSTPAKDVNALLIEAWKLGIKTLYYQISVNAAQEFSRNILQCTSCEA